MRSFEGRCAVVTGAGSGIGRACAQRLPAAGASVSVLDADGDSAEATSHAILEAGGSGRGYAVYVRDPAAVSAAGQDLGAGFGRRGCS